MAFMQSITSLVVERDKAFVERVAAELNLSYKELYDLYQEVAEAAIKVPRKYKKRDKDGDAEVVSNGKCQGITAKKEPCKFSALKGECFCKRHLNGGVHTDKTENTSAKPVKAEEPVHNHALDNTIHTDCDLCQSHGNPLANEDFDCEVVNV